jgi:hypothetical protein
MNDRRTYVFCLPYYETFFQFMWLVVGVIVLPFYKL